jgi:hypothetical protein
MTQRKRAASGEAGAALLLVLLASLVFVAIGAFLLMAVDRNTDMRAAYQRNVAGYNSAEAGVHIGAGAVKNALLNFSLPTNCSTSGTSFTINGRTVTYVLSVPPGAPWNGTSGSCTETPVILTEPMGSVFAGLNAQKYVYNLVSAAVNGQGFTESKTSAQFEADQIPMFQFGAFFATDIEFSPALSSTLTGRIHTNKDLYINADNPGTCGSPPGLGLNLLGPITIVGSGLPGTTPLNRGIKDYLRYNQGNLYISLDGTPGNVQILGSDAQGSANCGATWPGPWYNTRPIGTAEINSFNTSGQRITTGVQNIALPQLPGPQGSLCVPWLTGCGSTGGGYWQNATLRLALDTSTTCWPGNTSVDGSPCPGSVTAPRLYPVEVLDVNGNVVMSQTNSLKTFMQANPGAITYSDVPKASASWNCETNSSCESGVYNNGAPVTGGYQTPFPKSGTLSCTANRTPRTTITSGNYTTAHCYDYRYGGFYSWREMKPILILNIDWMALEEYNYNNSGIFFNASTTGGIVIFLTVKDTTTTEGLAATHYGVRVFDAGRARRGILDYGVTFATDQAMYLLGNFNCPVPNYSGSVSSPAPCGDTPWPPTSPTCCNTYQKPVSISADTINVLSCGWIQAAACGSFSMDTNQWIAAKGLGVGMLRPLDEGSTLPSGTLQAAVQTIVNAGFYSGTDVSWCPSNSNGYGCDATSNTKYYGGGLENYPRFHEDWQPSGPGPQNLWYQGSFVSSGTPNHTCFAYRTQLSSVAVADDAVFTCNLPTNSYYNVAGTQGFQTWERYNAPRRRFFYDTSFNNASYLPPASPRFVYLNLIFFTQNFN